MFCRPDRWLLGLPLLLLVAIGCLWRVEPDLDAAFRHGLANAAGPDASLRGVRLELDGRDLRIVADAPVPADAAASLVPRLSAAMPVRRLVWAVEPPQIASPYRFAAVRQGAGLRLTGHVPPGGLRAELLQVVSETSTAPVVDDALRTATGQPAAFEALARAATVFAAGLPDGRAEYDGERLVLAGTAPDAASYDSALELARSLSRSVAVSAEGLLPPRIDRDGWAARKTAGRVELTGFVPSESVRGAIAAAAALSGLAVEDRTRTARGPDPDRPVGAVARAALAWLTRVQDGEVVLDGGSLDARGETPARDLVPELETALRTRLPDGITVASVNLRIVPASPFRFEARRSDGRVTLAGFVPSGEDRTALAGLARQRFPFEAVANDLHVADGAPAGLLEAASLALTRLSAFAEGEAVLVDRAFGLSGRILYPEMAERARRGFGTGLPDGWTSRVAIRDGGESGLDDSQCADLLQDAARREPIPFEPGSAELGPAGRKAVAAWASIIRRCRRSATTVVGIVAADSEPDRSRALGERRARAVVAGLGPALDGSSPRSEGRHAASGPDRIVVEAAP